MDVEEVIRWLKTLEPESRIFIDDGGLAIMEIDKDGDETGAYLELGSRGVDGDFQ
jgi:hypothetical protein